MQNSFERMIATSAPRSLEVYRDPGLAAARNRPIEPAQFASTLLQNFCNHLAAQQKKPDGEH